MGWVWKLHPICRSCFSFQFNGINQEVGVALAIFTPVIFKLQAGWSILWGLVCFVQVNVFTPLYETRVAQYSTHGYHSIRNCLFLPWQLHLESFRHLNNDTLRKETFFSLAFCAVIVGCAGCVSTENYQCQFSVTVVTTTVEYIPKPKSLQDIVM